jgi:hypothetical protein
MAGSRLATSGATAFTFEALKGLEQALSALAVAPTATVKLGRQSAPAQKQVCKEWTYETKHNADDLKCIRKIE